MKKLLLIFISVFLFSCISAKTSYDNNLLYEKLSSLRKEIESKNLDLEEANKVFSNQFKNNLEGSGKINKIIFENASTEILITESPLPIKILFKGQFLLKQLENKEAKVIKFKVSKCEIAKEPILKTLRLPMTDSEYWIYLTFTDYGNGSKDDYVGDIKVGKFKY